MWKKFFKVYGTFAVRMKNLGADDSVDVEQLYQAFKARYTEEMKDAT